MSRGALQEKVRNDFIFFIYYYQNKSDDVIEKSFKI